MSDTTHTDANYSDLPPATASGDGFHEAHKCGDDGYYACCIDARWKRVRATVSRLTDMLRELWDLVPTVDRMCPCSDTMTRSDCVRCAVRAVLEDADALAR